MKKEVIFLLIACSFSLFSMSQDVSDVWIIKGKDIGSGIIFTPQDYIKKELNYSNLFVTAKENSEVISPISGKVETLDYSYYNTLSYSSTYDIPEINDSLKPLEKDRKIREIIANNQKLTPSRISVLLSIKDEKGRVYRFLGIRPFKFFKTGDKIRKGETIGYVGYSYHSVEAPSIMFSVDYKGKPVDPMGIFGLTTTFLPSSKKIKRPSSYKFSKSELLKDFIVFKNSLEESHPGLYDYISKKELDSVFDSVEKRLKNSMTSHQFKASLMGVLKEIRDSHTNIISKKNPSRKITYPPVLFGVTNDSVIVYATHPDYKQYLNKRIVRIDQKDVKNLIFKIRKLVYGGDGYINTVEKRILLFDFWKYYHFISSEDGTDELSLEFSDGSRQNFTYVQTTLKSYEPNYQHYSANSNFYVSNFKNSTYLLDINTFELTDKDIDSIGRFIKSVNELESSKLIIDVRDNLGGEVNNIERLYSFIATAPFSVTQYQKVNSNTTYQSFKHSLNIPQNHVLFENYRYSGNKNEYILAQDNFPTIKPNTEINFKGDVYLLINEFSQSASTIFPALFFKQKRGVIIGRETGSTYYQMNALKFNRVHLKHTGLELRIPLVKVVFDEDVDKDIPWGRGVIPDYIVSLQYEAFLKETDPIISKALFLIESKNTSFQERGHLTSVLILVLVLCIIFFKKFFVQ
ncbi:S41 family peptidase [Tenacibaculum sp.]|uniref:S41 family peptidase n=1 Tax=Tenacibaculum sp. TaxID=1906242 RepID=UPI003AA9229A